MKFFSKAVLALVACGYVAAKIDLPHGPRSMELMMPMRDGVALHTLIYFPKEYKDHDGKKFTTIIDRSPYGYGDMEWITDIFLPFGFVALGQDMRGTELSQGNFSMWMTDADDSADLGQWITAQEWSNGKVVTFGASADGIASMQVPRTNPSWLAAQYIAWAPQSMYDILFPYGAYKQETAEQWLRGLTMPNPDVVETNIREVHEHEAHDDWWAQIEMSAPIYANIKVPNAFWGGWYDLFEVGTLAAFEGYNTLSDPSVRGSSVITMDPLGHCLEGAEFFTENAVEGRTILVIGQLFAVYGIMPVKRPNIKNVTFYVMSSNDDAGREVGQYWTSIDTWPAFKGVDYFFHADKTASLLPPAPTTDVANAKTSFVFDPSNPVPTMGGNNLPDSIGGSIPCGPLDQAEVDKRSDVLTFQTSAFDVQLPLMGPLMATLYVSSDAKDTDFTVKISDVYPTGEARLIQDNAVRMRWRDSTPVPQYLTKGQVYEVNMNIWNTSYIVAPGHALRISISSSNWPRFSVNPNNGLLLADANYPGTNITATNTLHHSTLYRSKVTLPVVEKRSLPEVHVIKEMQEAYPSLTKEYITKMTQKLNKGLMRTVSKK